MKNKYNALIVFLLLLIFIVSACSNSTDVIDENGVIVPAFSNLQVYEQGHQIYETTCASCHGINGGGQFPDDPMKPDETGRYGAPPHNDDGHTWHHDDDLILQIINEGGMGSESTFYPMPAFADTFTTEEKIAVVSYIKTMWNEQNLSSQYRVTEAVKAQSQD